jgi:hypothetical protein
VDTLLAPLKRCASLQIGDIRMFGKTTRRLALAVGLAAVALTATQPAFAQDFFLPAGLGCEFNLDVKSTGGNLVTREFTDADGNLVRMITAGKGVDVTYTNYGDDPDNPIAGESVTVKTAGSVTKTVVNPDGTRTVTSTGHNGLILFPSDVPAGPTTTHYIGRIVYTIDSAGVFTLLSTTGQERDICAELA